MTWKNGEYQPRQQRAGQSKDRILKAALELFTAQGYHGTTAKAIAARAGVATGSFYRYFRDKKAAFMAVCLRREQEFGDRIFEFGWQMRREGHSEREMLTALVSFSVEVHVETQAFHREVLAMQISDPDVAAWAGEREKRLLATLADFLKPQRSSYRVKDLAAAAELIYYVTEEVSHRAVLLNSPAGRERLVRELQDMLVRYLFP